MAHNDGAANPLYHSASVELDHSNRNPPYPYRSRRTGQQLDWFVWGHCPLQGKARLDTPEHAERRIETYRKCPGWKMRAYQCPKCRKYHLTSVAKKRKA